LILERFGEHICASPSLLYRSNHSHNLKPHLIHTRNQNKKLTAHTYQLGHNM
jgi:hypothetical protein